MNDHNESERNGGDWVEEILNQFRYSDSRMRDAAEKALREGWRAEHPREALVAVARSFADPA